MKIGVSLKIDVTKIEKARLYEGKSGKYLDCVVFIDLDQQDQYGNNGMITQSWKDQQKGEGQILGNAKVFWSESGQTRANGATKDDGPKDPPRMQQAEPDFDDDIPF